MAVESATYISQLNASYPADSDAIPEGDNHIRLTKSALLATFAGFTGAAVTVTEAQLNTVTSRSLRAGDTYTGTHDFSGATGVTVPTLASGTSTTGAASTSFVMAAIATVNAQTALTLGVDSAASVQLVAGQHTVCSNASTVTASLPVAPTANQRCKSTFTNTLYSNVINPGTEKIFGVSGTRTVNAAQASLEWVYVNSSIGWVY